MEIPRRSLRSLPSEWHGSLFWSIIA